MLRWMHKKAIEEAFFEISDLERNFRRDALEYCEDSS